VTDLVLLPNGNVITAGQDGDLHELRDGRVIRKLATGGGAIATLARLDDGTLITASEEGAVIVRDAEGRELHRHAGTRGVPSPDGRLLAVGTLDGNVEVWEIASGTRIRTLGNVAGAMSSIRWSSDGKRIAGSTELGHVMVWTVEGALVRNIDRAKAGGGPIAFSPDGKWLVRAGEPADTLFSLDDGADRRLPGVPDAALVVGFSPHHESMLLAGVGYVATWDITTNQNRLRIATNNWITGAAFLAEDRYLIGGSIDRRVHVWDAETGAELLAFIAPAPVRRIVVDNKRVAVLTTRGALIWNVPGFEGTLDDLRALARCRIDIEIHDAHARTRAIDVAACNSHGR
jgi:WD40 repeat protein